MKTSEQRLEHMIRRMQTDSSVDAPADAIRYAKNLYLTRAPEPRPSFLERVFAVVRVDLAPNRAAFGERSASSSTARQMLFDSGENAVDLRITAAAKGFDIRGQILGSGFENGEVEISSSQFSAKTEFEGMSEFTFTAIPAGEYSLVIRGNSTEIFIEKISLQ